MQENETPNLTNIAWNLDQSKMAEENVKAIVKDGLNKRS